MADFITNRRILVVDDEKDILQAYVDFLSPEPSAAPKKSSRSGALTSASLKAPEIPYEIVCASSGEEAIAIVTRENLAGRPFAAGFFDVKLEGGIDGITTMQEIWKITPQLHTTVVTAYHDRGVNEMDQLFGNQFKDQWDYLNKPFTQAEIVQKARQMVASWNRRRYLEETQRQLVESERMAVIGQVARAIGHEFGNILQAIVGKADLGRSDTDLEKARLKFELILVAADRASLILRNLQSFSKGSPEKTKTKIAQVLKDTLLLVNHELKKNTITVTENFSGEGLIRVSPSKLEQVFLNLLINAKHAMVKGGKIEIGCEENEKTVTAWVKDNGTGIPPEILPKIFDYAFTTKGEQGSGLGLAISKDIVEECGGSIEVETVLGVGTKFLVKIPRLNN